MATRVSAADLARIRLRSQSLIATAAHPVTDTVRDMVAVQAQDFAAATWAVGIRTPGARRSDVRAALDQGALVRSWTMRGTLHLASATDLRWMLELARDRTIASAAARHRALGLTDEHFHRAAEISRAVLAGSRLGREAFLAALRQHGVDTAGQRGAHLLVWLAVTGVVCWGPSIRRVTQAGGERMDQALVLVDDWVPCDTTPPTKAEAQLGFLLRYLRGHGPATERDFAWWSNSTLTDVRAARAAAAEQIVELEADGLGYLAAADHPSPGRPSSAVLALPGFDEYLLGFSAREPVLGAEHAERIVPGGNGIFLPTIVAGGRVVGTWRRDARHEDRVLPDFFGTASAAELRGFETSAARYLRFLAG